MATMTAASAMTTSTTLRSALWSPLGAAFRDALRGAFAAFAAFAATVAVLQPLDGAAQFVNFALVAGFLNLCDLQHLQNILHRLQGFFQGSDDLLHIVDGLVNRRALRARQAVGQMGTA
jgi:hypothetical protein